MKKRSAFSVWRFKNTFALLLSLGVIWYLAEAEYLHVFVHAIGQYGYVGAFIAGGLYVSTFTVVPAAIVIFHIARELNPFWVAVIAGLGGVVGDYVLFRFLRDRVFEEIKPVYMKLGGNHLSRLLATPYFAWLMPVLGAVLIASPVPDEVGISMLGITKIRSIQFVLLTLVLNITGLLITIGLALNW